MMAETRMRRLSRTTTPQLCSVHPSSVNSRISGAAEWASPFLVFHERVTVPWERPSNVKFVDLGGGGLAELEGASRAAAEAAAASSAARARDASRALETSSATAVRRLDP